MRTGAPRPGLLGAQGSRRRKAKAEEGGAGRRRKRNAGGGQDGREGGVFEEGTGEG